MAENQLFPVPLFYVWGLDLYQHIYIDGKSFYEIKEGDQTVSSF